MKKALDVIKEAVDRDGFLTTAPNAAVKATGCPITAREAVPRVHRTPEGIFVKPVKRGTPAHPAALRDGALPSKRVRSNLCLWPIPLKKTGSNSL